MRSKFFILLVAVMVCLALVGSGCGMIAEKATEKAAEKAIEDASGGTAKVDLNSKDGSFEIKGDDGSSIKGGGASEWPKAIPSDVPKFNSGKIISALESSNDKNKSYTVVFENVSMDTFDKIKGELEGSGWKVSLTTQSEDGFMLIASKEKRQFSATVTDKTEGLISYSEEIE